MSGKYWSSLIPTDEQVEGGLFVDGERAIWRTSEVYVRLCPTCGKVTAFLRAECVTSPKSEIERAMGAARADDFDGSLEGDTLTLCLGCMSEPDC